MGEGIRENSETGDIETYEKETGKTTATQSRKKGGRKKDRKTRVVTTTTKCTVNILSEKTKDTIFELAREGCSIANIARQTGRGIRTLRKWLSHNHEFRKEFEASREVGVYELEDKMEALIENTDKKSKVMVNKFKFDALKQMGEIKHPKRFGRRSTAEGGSAKPVTIVFNTGIERTPIKDIKVDVKDVDESSD